MILKSIRLKNFRKFKDSYVEFPDGVTGVVGLNGVGKSTLFEAVAWTLYGSVAARTSTEQIKREDATSSEPCWVELDFIFDDDAYHVVREMSGKNLSASGSATVNGKLVVNGAEGLSKFIQKKLGMDWKSFYTSIFAKQKELNTLSSMNPSERRQLILRMLGINAVDEIISQIRSDIKEKKNLIETLAGNLVDEHGQNKILAFKKEIERQQEKQKERMHRMEEQKKHHQKIQKEFLNIKKDCETKKITYEKLLKESGQLEEKKSIFEKKQRVENDIRSLEKTLHERKESLEKIKKNLLLVKNLDKELQDFDKQQEKNTSSIQTLIQKKQQNLTLAARLGEEIKELTAKKRSIEKMGPQAKCPTCERILGDQQKKLIVTFTEDIEKKNHETHRLNEEQNKLQIEYDRFSREKQALQKKNMFLRSRAVEREKSQSTIRHTTAEMEREKQQLEQKKKDLKTLGVVDFDEKQYKLIRIQVNDCYKLYQGTLEKLDEIKEKQQKITIELKEQEGEKKLIDQQIKTYEQNIEDQQRLEKKLENERTEAQHYSMLSEVMESFRTYLISQIRPMLSAHASELFDELTDWKYSQIELDEDYDLLIYDHGVAYTIERFSGGEEDLANLCIRLAISEIITERAGSVFQFVILDEIFGSQDQIRKQNIIKTLNGFSSKFKQIFLITHVEDIKHFTEHTMMISEDETGISSIKIE
ncbi:MAG: SMC family ATPase [Euryarchaeota archaeon]|nr:SMC family ATPase [Euryarchaeota archaeon]